MLIVGSALGYFFLSGLQTFVVVFVEGHFKVGYGSVTLVLGLLLVGHPNGVNPDARLLAEARQRNWPVHDFRSGRRATLIALPIAAGAGAVAGGMAAGFALRRRRAAG